MKQNRTYLFIAISSIALLTVLIIQVNWILKAAEVKEEIFNEKANMVLSKTAEALGSDKATCGSIQNQTCVGKNEKKVIDSLFVHYMNNYNFYIDYTFEVDPGIPAQNEAAFAGNGQLSQIAYYKTFLQPQPGTSSLGLKLIIPEREKFIRDEMGPMFITSVVLILVVMVMSWRTVLSLLKEKRISEHTTDFLNNMTHEFKTPLTNIALAGRMITREQNIGQEEKVKHYTGIILEENEKLRLQVEQVLSMTALERGEIPLQKTELDIHQLIQDSLKCISVQIENRNGHVNLNTVAERFVVMGDKTHLTNTICNLVDNAIKYAGQKPEISIRTMNVDNNIVISVSDKGIGIDKEYHKKIFDTFFRVPTGDVHDVKGFGIGLAYVKKIVELHKGTIELESERGKGTTFTITIPNV